MNKMPINYEELKDGYKTLAIQNNLLKSDIEKTIYDCNKKVADVENINRQLRKDREFLLDRVEKLARESSKNYASRKIFLKYAVVSWSFWFLLAIFYIFGIIKDFLF